MMGTKKRNNVPLGVMMAVNKKQDQIFASFVTENENDATLGYGSGPLSCRAHDARQVTWQTLLSYPRQITR